MNGVMKHLDQSVPIYEGQDDAYRQTTIAPPLLAVPKGWRDTSGTENLRTSLDLTSDGSEVEPGQPPITSDYLADDLVDQAAKFARANPALFIGGSVAAGFAVARFLMSGGRRASRPTARPSADPYQI